MKKFLLSSALVLAMAGSAWAQDTTTTTATVNIQGTLEMGTMLGSLDFGTRAPGDSNVPATAVGAPNLSVVFSDSRALLDGYHMVVQSTDFSNGTGGTIPATGFEIQYDGVASVDLIDNDGGAETVPTLDPGLTSPQPLDQPVLIFEADQGLDPTVGKGSWVLVVEPGSFTLDIPPATPTGAYLATLTFSVNPGLFGPP
jgi:hypothetical protein